MNRRLCPALEWRVTLLSPLASSRRAPDYSFYLYLDRPTTLFHLVSASGPPQPPRKYRTGARIYVRTYVTQIVQFGKRPLLNSNLRGIVVKLRPHHYFKSPSIARIDRARSTSE